MLHSLGSLVLRVELPPSLILSISLHISSIVSPCLLCYPTMKDVGAVIRGVMGMTVDVSVGNMGLVAIANEDVVASKRDGTQS